MYYNVETSRQHRESSFENQSLPCFPSKLNQTLGAVPGQETDDTLFRELFG